MTAVFRVFSPSRRRTVLATTNHDKAAGRAHALNQGTTTHGGPADWIVQHANPPMGRRGGRPATAAHYLIPGRTGEWLVDLGHDPALYAPDEWRAPGDPTPLDAGTWGLKHGRLVRAGRGALLVQGPCWLTDLDARTRVWAAERRASRDARRDRARNRHIARNLSTQ